MLSQRHEEDNKKKKETDKKSENATTISSLDCSSNASISATPSISVAVVNNNSNTDQLSAQTTAIFNTCAQSSAHDGLLRHPPSKKGSSDHHSHIINTIDDWIEKNRDTLGAVNFKLNEGVDYHLKISFGCDSAQLCCSWERSWLSERKTLFLWRVYD